MKRHSKALVLFFGFILVFALVAAAQEKAADDTVTCPVSGKTVEKSEAKGPYVYKGNSYYFCCDDCMEAFIKDPEKYVHSDADSAVMDPVCGMKIKKSDAKANYEYKGNSYYFCSEECLEKFKKNPEQYANTAEEMVTCPVSGETIKKSKAAGKYEYKGETYYFCCPKCQEKFVKDPEKYVKKGGEMDTESKGSCAACASKKTQ